jgi:2-amino-4-hydroxy-6-hydroxymethyldihydropteridine diphosphokinase
VTQCFIGLGSNLNEPCDQLKLALAELAGLPDTRVLAHSPFYRSAPVGFLEQPDFVNAVAKIETALSPQQLLAALLDIERKHGRERTFANSPRTLDLDLLLYGESVIDEPGLAVPHPNMHKRAFVLLPLLDIAPDCVIPCTGLARIALESCLDQVIEKM